MNRNQRQFIEESERKYGPGVTLDRNEIDILVYESKCPYPYWLVTNQKYRRGRGLYEVPSFSTEENKEIIPNTMTQNQPEAVTMEMAQVVQLRQPKLIDESDSSIPVLFPNYVPFGFHRDLKNIIKSGQYYPVFVTGLSGNGKTLMVEQVCAELKRECIRVNVSIETDESDLLGGPTLVNGNVVNRDGPVIQAMKRGAILLIDEIDRGSNKLMCLQGILEGKPYYNKKNGELVHPKNGFNVIATANTKGRGSDDGKYLSQILDSAFLNRFIIFVEQEFPSTTVEQKILNSQVQEDFATLLVKWADTIRKTFNDGGIDETMSTRELTHIAKTFNIFNDREKAIKLVIAKHDEEVKNAFWDLYTKIDESLNPKQQVDAPIITPLVEDATKEIEF